MIKKLNDSTIKPWGKFYDLAANKGKWHLKLLQIKKDHRISLQKHQKRDEIWVLAEGSVRVRKAESTRILLPGDRIFINKKQLHRIKAIKDSVIVEITFGVHDEKDIVRMADDYKRK